MERHSVSENERAPLFKNRSVQFIHDLDYQYVKMLPQLAPYKEEYNDKVASAIRGAEGFCNDMCKVAHGKISFVSPEVESMIKAMRFLQKRLTRTRALGADVAVAVTVEIFAPKLKLTPGERQQLADLLKDTLMSDHAMVLKFTGTVGRKELLQPDPPNNPPPTLLQKLVKVATRKEPS